MYSTPDLKSFLKSLRAYGRYALREVLIKYLLCSTLKCSGWHRIPPWLDLFNKLLAEENFLLIILDACRYDFFQSVYSKYLNGRLIAAKSPGPDTYSWLPNAFSNPKFKNIRMFYAKLAIATHDVKLEEFVAHNTVEVIPIEPHQARHLGVALPYEVTNEVFRRGFHRRTIVWYMQPHYPWVCNEKLSLKLVNEVTLRDFTPKDLVAEKLKREGISRWEIVKAYTCNLELALHEVSRLIKYIKGTGFRGKVVVSSDHGELLGDYGLYLHPHYEFPQLYLVPWFEVEL